MRQTCQRCVTCPRLFTFSELECEYVVYDRIADKSGPRTGTSCTSTASWASTGAWRARCAGRSSGRATASCSVYPPPSAATASSTARTARTRTSAEAIASFVYIFPINTSLSNMLHTKVIDLIEDHKYKTLATFINHCFVTVSPGWSRVCSLRGPGVGLALPWLHPAVGVGGPVLLRVAGLLLLVPGVLPRGRGGLGVGGGVAGGGASPGVGGC